MNTTKFITKVLNEKLINNDEHLIKHIQSFLICFECEENLTIHDAGEDYNDDCVSCLTEMGVRKCSRCKKISQDQYYEEDSNIKWVCRYCYTN